jgi:hypothetical protein
MNLMDQLAGSETREVNIALQLPSNLGSRLLYLLCEHMARAVFQFVSGRFELRDPCPQLFAHFSDRLLKNELIQTDDGESGIGVIQPNP